MTRVTLAVALVVVCLSPAYAQLQPSGSLTPGHTFRTLTTGGVVGDAGGAAGSSTSGSGYLTELGITNTGLPLCINDALTNAVGGYHRLCLGANSLGGGLLSYDALGGASPLGLNIELNGTTYSFPGPGNGNVVGPASAVSGNLPSFNGTGGKTLQDSGFAAAAIGRIGFSQYGVVANGTDQTTNVQAAINAAHTAGEAVVCDVKGSIPVNNIAMYGATTESGFGDEYFAIPGCSLVPAPAYGGQDLVRLTDAVGHAYPQTQIYNVRFHDFQANMQGQHGTAIMWDSCISCSIDGNWTIYGIGSGTFTYTDATASKNVTIGGTITVGNTITYTFSSASLNSGNPVSVVYTVQKTDTTAIAAANSTSAINGNSTLAGALVGAMTTPADANLGIAASSVVRVYYPSAWSDFSLTATVSVGGTETALVTAGTITYPDAGIVLKGDHGTGAGAYYARIVGGILAPQSCGLGISGSGEGLWLGSSGSVARPNAANITGTNFINAPGAVCGFSKAIDLNNVGDVVIDGPTDVSFANIGVQLGGTGGVVTHNEIRHLFVEQPGTCGVNRTADSTGTIVNTMLYTLAGGQPLCGLTFGGRTFDDYSGSLTIGFNAGTPQDAPIFSSNNEIQEVPWGGSLTIGGQTNGTPGYHELMSLGTASQHLITRYDSSANPYSWKNLQALGSGERIGQYGFAAAYSSSLAYPGAFAAGATTEAQSSTNGGQQYQIFSTLNGTNFPREAWETTSTGGVHLCGDTVSGACSVDPGLGGFAVEGQGVSAVDAYSRSNYNYALSSGFGGAAGSGYAVNDTITLAGPTCTTPIVVTVDNVNASGAITAIPAVGTTPGLAGWHISTAGVCSVRASSLTQASTSGGGSGATFTAQGWSVANRTAITSGQQIAETDWYGYDGSADYLAASVHVTSGENFVHGTNGGTKVEFQRTINGSASRQNALIFQTDGSISTCDGSGSCAAAAGNGNLGVKGTATLGGLLKIPPIASASLPTCNAGAEGSIQPVNDATSATFNAAVAGSGTNHIIAYCNGSGWVVH